MDAKTGKHGSSGSGAFIAVSGVIIIVLLAVLFSYERSLEKRIQEGRSSVSAIEQQLQLFQETLPKLEELKNETGDLKEYMAAVREFSSDPSSDSARLASIPGDINKAVPEGLYLKNIEIDRSARAASIEGIAAPSSIKTFLAALAKSDLLENPRLKSEKNQTGDNSWETFEIEAGLK